MEMQVDEHTKRVLQESITTATQEREALQEMERALELSAAFYKKEVAAQRREKRVLEKAISESLLRVSGHRYRHDINYTESPITRVRRHVASSSNGRKVDPPSSIRRRRHRASALNGHTWPSAVVAEEVAEEAAATASLECAVCLDELYSSPCAMLSHQGVLICSHVLHIKCAAKCYHAQSLCPICRKSFDALRPI